MTVNYILTCVFLLLFLNAQSKDQLVSLEWKFTGIEEGFDHLNRSKIYIDGKEMPLSGVCHQSEWGYYPLRISKSNHHIKLVNEAFYNGKWVEHTFENQFSINAVCEFDLRAKKVSRVRIEFDLDGSGVSVIQYDSEGNALFSKQTFKGKHYPMTVKWKFIHIEPGYDHLSRMRVFIDEVEYGTSAATAESEGGIAVFKIPKGSHRIRLVNQSCVDGKWQDHTIVNNYSVEAVYEKTLEVKRGVRVNLVIDLNNEHTEVEWE
jgi:hypothetical protein